MTQEQIHYGKIIELGFNEEQADDSVFEYQNGYPYTIVSKDLTKKIQVIWYKDTKTCEVLRVNKSGDIKSRAKVKGLDHLNEIIDFFTDKD